MSAMRTHAAFENNFVLMLDKNAPKKTKTWWGNQKLHFNQNVRRQIMIRHVSKTRQVSQKILVTFLSDDETCWQIWINKPNWSTLRNVTVDYNSKPFWKVCKPYLSNKNSYTQENTMLLEKDKLLSKQKDVTTIFNKHFRSIADSLNLLS